MKHFKKEFHIAEGVRYRKQKDFSICNQDLSYICINTLSLMLSIYCLCTYVNLLERTSQFMQPVNLTCYVESVIDTYEISADEKET